MSKDQGWRDGKPAGGCWRLLGAEVSIASNWSMELLEYKETFEDLQSSLFCSYPCELSIEDCICISLSMLNSVVS